jgi:hypothetical protein
VTAPALHGPLPHGPHRRHRGRWRHGGRWRGRPWGRSGLPAVVFATRPRGHGGQARSRGRRDAIRPRDHVGRAQPRDQWGATRPRDHRGEGWTATPEPRRPQRPAAADETRGPTGSPTIHGGLHRTGTPPAHDSSPRARPLFHVKHPSRWIRILRTGSARNRCACLCHAPCHPYPLRMDRHRQRARTRCRRGGCAPERTVTRPTRPPTAARPTLSTPGQPTADGRRRPRLSPPPRYRVRSRANRRKLIQVPKQTYGDARRLRWAAGVLGTSRRSPFSQSLPPGPATRRTTLRCGAVTSTRRLTRRYGARLNDRAHPDDVHDGRRGIDQADPAQPYDRRTTAQPTNRIPMIRDLRASGRPLEGEQPTSYRCEG